MSNAQIKTVLKAVATVLRLTGKAIVYLCLALYVVGELLFSELETVEAPKPARTVAKTIAQPTVLAIEIPGTVINYGTSDAEKEGIAIAADATLTAVQLRKECSALGIKWRNAHGTSKHLTKAEMLQALAA